MLAANVIEGSWRSGTASRSRRYPKPTSMSALLTKHPQFRPYESQSICLNPAVGPCITRETLHLYHLALGGPLDTRKARTSLPRSTKSPSRLECKPIFRILWSGQGQRGLSFADVSTERYCTNGIHNPSFIVPTQP